MGTRTRWCVLTSCTAAFVVLLCSACAGAVAPGGLAWNVSTDWGSKAGAANANLRNPNGDWCYAEAAKPGAQITRLSGSAVSSQGSWAGFHHYWTRCLAGKNTSRVPIHLLPADGGAWLAPGQVALYPGLDRTVDLGILRWTSPCRARVKLSATFSGNHIPVGDTDPGTVSQAMVIRSGSVVWTAPIRGFVGCRIGGKDYPRRGESPSQVLSMELEVGEGDTIDFACDFSKTPGLVTGNMWAGLTGVSARIELVRFLPPAARGSTRQARVSSAEGWVNALAPKGKPGPELALSTNGKANYTILLPRAATAQDEKAARELRLWLGKITGADFRARYEGHGPTGKVISIGRTQLMQKAKLVEARADLGDEGYAISVSHGNLFLLGGQRRGPINAVYALLEEDLGCRWYDSYSSDFPVAPSLKFRPVPRSCSPPLQVRDLRIWDAMDTNWSLRNRVAPSAVVIPEEWGGYADSAYTGPVSNMVPYGTYHAEHPEYFAGRATKWGTPQLCMTNPDVLRMVVGQVREYLRSNPRSEFISVEPNGGGMYCECANCKAIDDAEGTKAGSLIRFCNSVAEAIEGEFPGVRISTGVFGAHAAPPKTIRPHRNIVVQVRAPGHSWGTPFHPLSDASQFKSNLEAWAAIGTRVDVWDPTVDGNFLHSVMPNVGAYDYIIGYYAKHGASGITLDGPSESPGGDNARLRAWVWAKKLWDPSLDTRELMRDFIFGYYKEAAQPVWDYNMMLWRVWEDNGGKRKAQPPLLFAEGYSVSAKFMGKELCQKALPLFDEAQKLAKSSQVRDRVAVAKFPVLYLYLCQELGFYMPKADSIREYTPEHVPSSQRKQICNRLDEWQSIARIESVTSGARGRLDFDEYSRKWDAQARSDARNTTAHLLSMTWKMKMDPEDAGVREKWYAPETDDSVWSSVDTDRGSIYDKDSSFKGYNGLFWFRQWFTVPDEFASADKIYLNFEAADDQAEVYVNGKLAYEQTVKATRRWWTNLINSPFAFDVKPFLRPGENVVAVRLQSQSRTGGIWCPAALAVTDLDPNPVVLKQIVRNHWKQWNLWPQVDVRNTVVRGLSNEWKFKPDPQKVGVDEKWFDAAVSDASWPVVRSDLGLGYDEQGFPEHLGISWYRQSLTIPSEFAASANVYLYFGCVDEQAEVFVNGKRAFDHTAAATQNTIVDLWNRPFAFDVRPFLQPGENIVAVRVTNDYAMGGVWKPAFLIGTDIKPDPRLLEVAIHKLGMN